MIVVIIIIILIVHDGNPYKRNLIAIIIKTLYVLPNLKYLFKWSFGNPRTLILRLSPSGRTRLPCIAAYASLAISSFFSLVAQQELRIPKVRLCTHISLFSILIQSFLTLCVVEVIFWMVLWLYMYIYILVLGYWVVHYVLDVCSRWIERLNLWE